MNFGEWFRFHILGDDSSDLIGKYGEDLIARKLKWAKIFGFSGLVLRNVYIPAELGETTEVDLIYITKKGLFIIESKNYSGWIFGRERDRYWTQSMPDRSKNRFFNPILQNRGHIKWLKDFLHNETIPCFSLIVFSERCELKQLQFYDENCKVIHRGDLFLTVRSMWKRLPDKLDKKQRKNIYASLSVLQNADEAMKQQHIDRIRQAYGTQEQEPALCGESFTTTDTPDTAASLPDSSAAVPEQSEKPEQSGKAPENVLPSCPKCGSALILRIAKRGENAGKQFYGCSAFPKCRYMQNIEQSQEESLPEKTVSPAEMPAEESADVPEPAAENSIKCPKCGAAMVLRTAKHGENTGKQFYGCTAFPKCRGMIQLPKEKPAGATVSDVVMPDFIRLIIEPESSEIE